MVSQCVLNILMLHFFVISSIVWHVHYDVFIKLLTYLLFCEGEQALLFWTESRPTKEKTLTIAVNVVFNFNTCSTSIKLISITTTAKVIWQQAASLQTGVSDLQISPSPYARLTQCY